MNYQRIKDVQIEICAVLNDTTGTLMSCGWKNHDCRIGVIVGNEISFILYLDLLNYSRKFVRN